MNATFRGILLATLLALPVAAQDSKRPDDVIQRRDGGILVGRILKMGPSNIEIIVNGDREPRRISIRDVMPYSIYRLRLERCNKDRGADRMTLGEFCLANGLYSTAAREFEKAAELDKSLAAKAGQKRAEAHNEDARTKFEEARGLHLKKDFSGATKLLHTILNRYSDTPYAAEAQKLVTSIAAQIKKANEQKKEQLAKAKKQKILDGLKVKENQDKDVQNQIVKMIEDAAKFWGEGLDHEPRNLTRADRAWRAAEQSLLKAKAYTAHLLKSNDVEMLKKGKELDAQVNGWLVKTYYRLGRMWAVELSYPRALEWLNKGMKLPKSEAMEHLFNDVLVEITKLKMRERAAGRGF